MVAEPMRNLKILLILALSPQAFAQNAELSVASDALEFRLQRGGQTAQWFYSQWKLEVTSGREDKFRVYADSGEVTGPKKPEEQTDLDKKIHVVDGDLKWTAFSPTLKIVLPAGSFGDLGTVELRSMNEFPYRGFDTNGNLLCATPQEEKFFVRCFYFYEGRNILKFRKFDIPLPITNARPFVFSRVQGDAQILCAMDHTGAMACLGLQIDSEAASDLSRQDFYTYRHLDVPDIARPSPYYLANSPYLAAYLLRWGESGSAGFADLENSLYSNQIEILRVWKAAYRNNVFENNEHFDVRWNLFWMHVLSDFTSGTASVSVRKAGDKILSELRTHILGRVRDGAPAFTKLSDHPWHESEFAEVTRRSAPLLGKALSLLAEHKLLEASEALALLGDVAARSIPPSAAEVARLQEALRVLHQKMMGAPEPKHFRKLWQFSMTLLETLAHSEPGEED
jgi:hypothetical protein